MMDMKQLFTTVLAGVIVAVLTDHIKNSRDRMS
jgi:hypothetical protein